ncbi:MAG: hypothetical protein F6K55_35405 [Moorea sp. SIO4A3]|nr:hypothetical protein [Moorena sp. SIO4A3]
MTMRQLSILLGLTHDDVSVVIKLRLKLCDDNAFGSAAPKAFGSGAPKAIGRRPRYLRCKFGKLSAISATRTLREQLSAFSD